MEEFTQQELEEFAELYSQYGFQVGGENGMADGDISIFCTPN